MSDSEAQDRSIWIRMRNLALEYVGIGWFLTQVIGVMARDLGWPPRVGDYLVIALGLGFVGTLLTAIVMAKMAPERMPRRKRGLALAAFAAVAAMAVWGIQVGRSSRDARPAGMVSESRGLFSTSTDVDGFFVVHPQDPLLQTGIFVKRGQKLSAWGEGRINLALASLVEAAQAGDSAAYEWVGPEGEIDSRGLPVVRRDRARAGREQCLLHRAYPYGALLAMITPSDRIAPGTARTLAEDREVFVVGTHLDTALQVSGYLTLGVNDVYLDRPECDPEAVAAGRDPGAFFRDNLGFFTVRLRVY